MCSRCHTKSARALMLVTASVLLTSLVACSKGSQSNAAFAAAPAGSQGVIDSALEPGVNHTLVTTDPRAAAYYDNAEAVNTGKQLFKQYNCSGCHSNGGGGMGPSLMDGEWIYGDRLEQIHQTLVEGRPNGMPSWGGKVSDPQLWQISAYVRSLSLPQTLAAQNGPTPSQTPAPVPRSAEQDTGWAPPPDTSNDFGATTQGPD
jgi:cytochrome c oxidase cbb3-type subunit 3